MPKITELRGHLIQARRVPAGEVNGAEMYELAFIDQQTGDVIHLRFNRDARDMVIGQLQGGIVVATDFPT